MAARAVGGDQACRPLRSRSSPAPAAGGALRRVAAWRPASAIWVDDRRMRHVAGFAALEAVEVGLPLGTDAVRSDQVLLVQVFDVGGIAPPSCEDWANCFRRLSTMAYVARRVGPVTACGGPAGAVKDLRGRDEYAKLYPHADRDGQVAWTKGAGRDSASHQASAALSAASAHRPAIGAGRHGLQMPSARNSVHGRARSQTRPNSSRNCRARPAPSRSVSPSKRWPRVRK